MAAKRAASPKFGWYVMNGRAGASRHVCFKGVALRQRGHGNCELVEAPILLLEETSMLQLRLCLIASLARSLTHTNLRQLPIRDPAVRKPRRTIRRESPKPPLTWPKNRRSRKPPTRPSRASVPTHLLPANRKTNWRLLWAAEFYSGCSAYRSLSFCSWRCARIIERDRNGEPALKYTQRDVSIESTHVGVLTHHA
jgi:hypothetical protein